MKMYLVCFFLFLLCGVTGLTVRKAIFLNSAMNWTNAQQYCQHHYNDLLTITSNMENQMIINAFGQNLTDSWIGLHRSKVILSPWLWSDGETSSFVSWAGVPPSNSSGVQNCVKIQRTGWNNDFCLKSLPFFCESVFVLVQVNKTWEEAYEHCTAQYTGLASLTSNSQLKSTQLETNNTQTDRVWTGLRFLAGNWFWVNGDPLRNMVSLPSCPAQPYWCGARNTRTNAWENRDCEEQLFFLCY